jgi:EmrB/QacA subfamily drug resistance transporter
MNRKLGAGTGALVVLCLAQLLLIVDVVVVNVALPAVQDDLGVPAGYLQLTSVAYTVPFGALLLVAGRLGDVWGQRRAVHAGLVLFVLASLLSGLAAEPWQLFAARALQGVGAALVSPNALALLLRVFGDEERRGRALGVWAAVGSAGAIAGQLAGGVLTDLAGWRSVFLVNVPIGLVVLLVLHRVAPGTRTPGAARPSTLGSALLIAVIGGGSLLLADATTRWSALHTAALVVVVLLAIAFLVTERRTSRPLVQPGLLRHRGVRVGNLVLVLNVAALTTAMYLTSLTMQNQLGLSAMQTGLAFAPITLIVLLVSPRAGAVVARVGARPLLVAGGICTTAGLVVLALFAEQGYLVGVLPGLVLVALGSGLGYAPTFTLATAVDDSAKGSASGLVTTTQELGAAVGLTVLTTIGLLLATPTLPVTQLTYAAAAVVGALSVVAALAAGRSAPVRDASPEAVRS